MPARSKELEAFKKEKERDRRAKISITRCLQQLTEVQADLEQILQPTVFIDQETGEQTEIAPRINPAHIGALKLKADIAFRLLAKRMPDLKAVEHTGEVATANRLIIEKVANLDQVDDAVEERATH